MKRNFKYTGSGKDGTLRRVSANLTTWPAKKINEPPRRPYGAPTEATIKARADHAQKRFQDRIKAAELQQTLDRAKQEARARHQANKPKPKAVLIRNTSKGIPGQIIPGVGMMVTKHGLKKSSRDKARNLLRRAAALRGKQGANKQIEKLLAV